MLSFSRISGWLSFLLLVTLLRSWLGCSVAQGVLRGSPAQWNSYFKIRFSQAKLDPDPDVMALLLQMSHLRSQFLAWLAGEMRLLSQKRNKLAWLETLDLKTGGATTSALKMANKKSRYLSSSCS